MVGTLYLIPTPLSKEDINWVIPDAVKQRVADISYYIVEHPKTARQFLKQVGCKMPLQQINMQVLDEHTQVTDLVSLLNPLLAGHDVGLVSEAGCPAVADPGAELVRLAHQKNIPIVPLVGPSSIILALMASGLNGQCFSFHGYLPIKMDARTKKIIELEKLSINNEQTQIFIETPYRNQKLLEQLVNTCRDSTDLCIASHLTADSEKIITKTISAWKKGLPEINKIPTIFLLHG
ncbi:MAG: SAM-dependent methyltransferase [Betaproteobacteria bacterium]|nr:SAM-dependent methyltransferase [Betaproteobacteria bacterium]